MPLKIYTDVNGDRYIYKYVGKVEPDAETVNKRIQRQVKRYKNKESCLEKRG